MPGDCPKGGLPRYYPAQAQQLGVQGVAVIRCKLRLNGHVDQCVVASESPSDYGFGEAALKMTCLFKMKPKVVDGMPVDGAEVTIPLKFHLKR